MCSFKIHVNIMIIYKARSSFFSIFLIKTVVDTARDEKKKEVLEVREDLEYNNQSIRL